MEAPRPTRSWRGLAPGLGSITKRKDLARRSKVFTGWAGEARWPADYNKSLKAPAVPSDRINIEPFAAILVMSGTPHRPRLIACPVPASAGMSGGGDSFTSSLAGSQRKCPANIGSFPASREPGHPSGRHVMHRCGDLQLPGVDELLDYRAALGQACRRQAGVRLGDLLNQRVVMRVALAVRLAQRGERRLEVLEQGRDIADLDIVDRALDRAAQIMSQNTNRLGAGDLG